MTHGQKTSHYLHFSIIQSGNGYRNYYTFQYLLERMSIFTDM